ncbi:hypothetical protein AAG570_000662 [Ranatra chinensis]|uniref:Ig-like domain-containing protein n=1 Tax=Ranatra chinensis TaxID=642074 RepID=A0ABD0YXR5_9HEMI
MCVCWVRAGGEVHFHFLASRREGGRVRDVLSSLVEKGKLGNLTLISTHFAFKQEPTLMLKSVSVNHKEGLVRQGDSFLLSCLAQGSAGVSFRWFKDGAPVNVSKATRKMKEWVGLHDSSDKITSFLEVEKAEVLDGGQFTCRALDWGYQQCKSIRIYIVQPLKVNVAPVTSTIEKGRNLTIRCSTPVKHARTKYGYNWTKNKSLFRMDTKKEFWEDLYPEGSILKIYNIQVGMVSVFIFLSKRFDIGLKYF